MNKVASATPQLGRSPTEALTAQTIEDLMMNDLKPTEEKERHWFLDHKAFQLVIYSAIISNAIVMGCAIDFPEHKSLWDICDNGFTALFLVEMFIKLYFLQKAYFSNGWNRMDCFLVVMSILDSWIIKPLTSGKSGLRQLSALRLIRIFRVARLVRLLKVFKELWIILKGIMDSLRTMFWVSCLLLLTLYVSSILCVDELGRDTYFGYEDDQEVINDSLAVAGWNNYVYFGTITRSMYTLFNIVIMAEWPEIGRPLVERKPSMIFFFCFFIIFTTFGVLNVIIGVIVDNTMEAAKDMEAENKDQEKAKRLALLGQIRDMVFALDTDGSGSIAIDELKEGWDQPVLQSLLQMVNLPKAFTPQELMYLMDNNSDEELTYSEFMKSFYRLISGDGFQQNCCMYAALNQIKTQCKELKLSINGITDRLDQIEAKVDAPLSPPSADSREPPATKSTAYKENSKPVRHKQQVQPDKQNGSSVGPDAQTRQNSHKRQQIRQIMPRHHPEPHPQYIYQYSGDPRVPPYFYGVNPGYRAMPRPISAPPMRGRGPPAPQAPQAPQAPVWYDRFDQPYVLPEGLIPYPGQPVFIE